MRLVVESPTVPDTVARNIGEVFNPHERIVSLAAPNATGTAPHEIREQYITDWHLVRGSQCTLPKVELVWQVSSAGLDTVAVGGVF